MWIVPEDFDPTQPIEFPTNYPGEAFYQLAEAAMESADGRRRCDCTFALEATFNGGIHKNNDQTVFGRIRFRVEGLQQCRIYRLHIHTEKINLKPMR